MFAFCHAKNSLTFSTMKDTKIHAHCVYSVSSNQLSREHWYGPSLKPGTASARMTRTLAGLASQNTFQKSPRRLKRRRRLQRRQRRQKRWRLRASRRIVAVITFSTVDRRPRPFSATSGLRIRTRKFRPRFRQLRREQEGGRTTSFSNTTTKTLWFENV